MIEIQQINHQDADALENFYRIGKTIRTGLSYQEIDWTDDHGVDQLIDQDNIQIQLLQGKGNGHLGRLAVIHFQGESHGIIGWYECGDDDELSQELLNAAFEILRTWKCDQVIGPMNGSTWNTYRFNKTSDKPLLPGDPYQPLYYIRQWEKAGFSEKTTYQSDRAPVDLFAPMTLKEGQELAKQFNLSVDYYPTENTPEFLKQMHEFYHTCFARNPLFQPINQKDFNELSAKFARILNQECSLLVKDREGNPVSVLLSYQDIYHDHYKAGQITDEIHKQKRLFIKTIATHPDWQGKQIGTLLVNLTQNLAKEAGYAEIYHLLMFKENLSATKGKEKFVTEKVREYALYQKAL